MVGLVGLVWFGLVWYGVVWWCGVVWYGVVWWYGVAWQMNKSNILGHILTEDIYQCLLVLFVFALFAFHVHVAGGTLST